MFVTPSEFTVLEAKFKELTIVDCVPESPHQPSIHVQVVFVTCLVDHIKITSY
jgi:hypothetical protein